MTAVAPDADADRRRIDLSRSEQWVLHDVMLARCEAARSEDRTPPWWAVDAVERAEAGTFAFTPFEAWRLRQDLAEYVQDENTPEEDVAAGQSILHELESTFEAPPSDI